MVPTVNGPHYGEAVSADKLPFHPCLMLLSTALAKCCCCFSRAVGVYAAVVVVE